MIPEKFLPLGTIVLLNGGEKKLMIAGFAVSSADDNKTYDYLGCLYPEGVISNDQNLVFNHDQIVQIVSMGFDSEENREFQAKLKEVVSGNGANAEVTAAPVDNNLF